jgi:Flp pilus assembly protein TadG
MGKISLKHRDARRGAAAVEFAITAPVFFLFLLAAFEFGWLNVIRHTADNAAYEAARTAIVPGATVADAQAKADKILKIVGTRSAKVTITPNPVTVDTSQVTVSIEVPMKKNGLIVPRFTGKTKILATSTLRTERAE